MLGWGRCSRASRPRRHLLLVSPKPQPRRRFRSRHSPTPLVPVPAQSIPQIRTPPSPLLTARALQARQSARRNGVCPVSASPALGRRRVGCFPLRLLPESASRKDAAENQDKKKNKSREEVNEEDKTERTHTAAGHERKRYLAPARRSAFLEFQPSEKDFHVLESPPVLGSQSLEGRQPKNDN
jgi:hypothetical protein